MKVKVCGITRLDDAKLAAELGAWAIGFIFARESPRYVTPEAAREISEQLPEKLLRVGVVVNPTEIELADLARVSGVSRFQFHGEESAAFCAKSPVPYFKALSPGVAGDLLEISRYPHAELILIDARTEGARGGTGQLVDRKLAIMAVSRAPGRVLLAGGMNAETVTAAIRELRPAGIDVSSGLESAPGLKDAEKMKRFFAAVKGARP